MDSRFGAPAVNPQGLTILTSRYSPQDTIDRLADAASGRGMTVFARIDQAAAAKAAGLALLPMEVLIFGAPRAGTPLMQAAPTIGIDLPLRALAFEDAKGGTWLAYNEPRWLAERHGLDDEVAEALETMTKAIAALCALAAGVAA